MVIHNRSRASLHDQVVRAAKQIYERYGKKVWINPGQEKNRSWAGQYIDVIAADHVKSDSAWVIEVETEESVNAAEARTQWRAYSEAFTNGRWYLAVPKGKKALAERLSKEYGVKRVAVITWAQEKKDTISFWGLPGLDK